MTGRIYAGSTDIYEDQAKALLEYYEKIARSIVEQEMGFEQSMRAAQEELVQVEQLLKTSNTQAFVYLSVGAVMLAFGWLLDPVVSFIGLAPSAFGGYKLRSAKEQAAVRTAELHRQIQSFQDAHRAIRRDFKVHRLGVVYVGVASQIPFESGSILVDHSGSVGKKQFTLSTLKSPEELKESVARIEESLSTVPLVERSANVERVDTAEYSTSIQQVSLYDYLGGMDRDMRNVSYLLGEVDRVSVSLSIIAPETRECQFLFEHGTSDLPDGAAELKVFDLGADDANLQTFQELNELKKSLEGPAGEYVAFFRKLMRQLAETTQLLTQMKASSSSKMIESSSRAFLNVLMASFNHYSPVLEAEEIERIRSASFDFQESEEEYKPFNLRRSSLVRFDLISRNWVAEDGSRTSFPFGMHQIQEEVIAPLIQNLMEETRSERLKIYSHIKDQKRDYLNQWHRETLDFYGRNRAEHGDLINRMRETFAEYTASGNTLKVLQGTQEQLAKSGALDDATVQTDGNQAEVLAAFELQARGFQEQQEEFSGYMERLKEDIDRRAEGFERIEFFDASLRDGEARDIARSDSDTHELDPRRKRLLAAGSHFARFAELPPQPRVEDAAYEDFSINLSRSAEAALTELDLAQEPARSDGYAPPFPDVSGLNVAKKPDRDGRETGSNGREVRGGGPQ